MTAVFADLPRAHYRVVYADPPWKFAAWSHRGEGRGATQHYPCMEMDEIKALPVGEIAAARSLRPGFDAWGTETGKFGGHSASEASATPDAAVHASCEATA